MNNFISKLANYLQNIKNKKENNESKKSLNSNVSFGWKDKIYKEMDLENFYNKCYLVLSSLFAENLNYKNIITETRYFNVSRILSIELKVLNYLKENDYNQVLYRVISLYEGKNSIVIGVIIEISSIEDKCAEVQYYVYV